MISKKFRSTPICLLIICLILTSSCHIFRKGRPTKVGKHYKNRELENYAGKWININKKDTIELQLTFYKHFSERTRAYYDALGGELKYTPLNTGRVDSVSIGHVYSLRVLGKKKNAKWMFNFFFYDKIKRKNGFALMEFDNKKDTIAFWRLGNMERHLINGKKFDSSWSIPDSLYLTKVK